MSPLRVRLFLAVGLSLSLPSSATEILSVEVLRGKIFEKGAERGAPLFTVETRLYWRGTSLSRAETRFLDPKGEPAVSSFETFDASGLLSEAHLTQHQLNEEGSLERIEGQAVFRYLKGEAPNRVAKDGKESWPSNLVLGTTLLAFLREHWTELLEGKSLDVRFGVFERTETYGFRLAKLEEKKVNERDVIVVRMKPISFFVAQVVDPIDLTLDREDQSLLSLAGRTGPKLRQKDGTWADFDADIVYETEFPPSAERLRAWGTQPR